jgi:hypothetical protein
MEVPFVIEVDVKIELYHSRNLRLCCSCPDFLFCAGQLVLPERGGSF